MGKIKASQHNPTLLLSVGCLKLTICYEVRHSGLEGAVTSQTQIRVELSNFLLFVSTQLSIILHLLYLTSDSHITVTTFSNEAHQTEEGVKKSGDANSAPKKHLL